MEKFLVIGLLTILGAFLIKKVVKPPVGPSYKLKTIIFAMGSVPIPMVTELGNLIFVSKGKRKFILPTEFDLWQEVKLFENGIVLKRNKKEKIVFFHELYAIEPMLIHSLFVKGKYFGYALQFRNNERIDIKSCDLEELDVLIEKLCLLFPDETGKALICDVD